MKLSLDDLERLNSQTEITELPDQIWDVVIVGAGPAGAYAGIHLADKKLKVLLIDGTTFPRDKTCGDALIADSIKCLEKVGLIDTIRAYGFEANNAIVSSPSGHKVDIRGDYITLKRRYLDAIIADGAVKRGCRFTQGYVNQVEIDGEFNFSTFVKGSEHPLRSKLVFIATGGNISLPQKLNIIKKKNPSGIAIRSYIKSSHEIKDLIISFDDSILPGYAWIFPLGKGEYNIGCGTFFTSMKNDTQRLKEAFSRFMNTYPEAKKLMSGTQSEFSLKGCPLRCGLSGAKFVTDKQMLAIGETIGTTFPFTGEGIGKAMETGELAADIAADALQQNKITLLKKFPKIVKAKLESKYFGYKMAEKISSNRSLLDAATKRANQSKKMQDALAGIVAETVNPKSLTSVSSLVKAMRNNG